MAISISSSIAASESRRDDLRAATWSRSEFDGRALDVLDLRTSETRSWYFVWPGRVVIQARSGGVSFTYDGLTQAVPAGCGLLVEAFGARTKIDTLAGTSLRVLFEVGGLEDRSGSRACMHAPQLGPALALDAGAAELFCAAIRAASDVACIGRVLGPVARARAYIEENLQEDFDLETLSDIAGVERCHLCRMFQRTLGLPPYRFRTHLRVAQARKLLASGIDCIEAAYAVGFCDQSHFTRCFKELTGTTPGAYARSRRTPRLDRLTSTVAA